jgi:hypothetical protein
MTSFLASWKTNIIGFLILCALVGHWWQTKSIRLDDLHSVLALLVSIGFFTAKDFNATGGTT